MNRRVYGLLPRKRVCPHYATVVVSTPSVVKVKANGRPAHGVATIKCFDCGLTWLENAA